MRFVIFGNCQQYGFATIAKALAPDHEYFLHEPCHLITSEGLIKLRIDIAKADVFIVQPIANGYRDNFGISTEELICFCKKDALIIKLPNIFFGGYYPSFDYLIAQNKVISYRQENQLENVYGDYFDFFLLAAIEQELPINDLIDVLWSKATPKASEVISNIANESIATLREKESSSSCNLIISDYVSENYKIQKLYHSLNHPANVLLFESVKRVLDLAGLAYNQETVIHIEILGNWRPPIYPLIESGLGLDFSNLDLAGGGINDYDMLRFVNPKECFKIFLNLIEKYSIDTLLIGNQNRSGFINAKCILKAVF